MLSRRQFLQLSTACIASTLLPSFPRMAHAQEVGESRAIFDESLSWITESAAHNVCQRIKHAGFNVLMACVWHGRGTSWPSSLAPWDNDRLEELASHTPNFDPLATLLRVAQQYELEVHAWFTVMLRQRAFLHQYCDEGTPDQAFEVHRPEFRDFISRVIHECVSRYPIHGVNLDYIRSVSISKSAYCVDAYKKATGRNLTLDRLSYGIGTEAREAIAHWQQGAVGDIVQQVSQAARAANAKIGLSVCGNPGNPALYIQGQNSIKWADEGLIDVIYAMHYPGEPNWEEIRKVQATMMRPKVYVVLCGNYDSVGPKNVPVSREAAKVSAQISQSRQIGQGNGVGLYLYSLLNDEQIDALRAGPFRVPAKPKWTRAGTSPLSSPTVLMVR